MTTFLQGNVTSFQVVPSANELGWRSLFGAAYFEDAIKLLPNLTFEAGLRYEFTTGWNEESGRAANYLTDSNGILVTTPRVGSSAFTQNNATHLLGPRAALAWDVFGNGKTAVRAGYGTYYSLIDDLSFLLNSIPPNNGSVSKTGSLPTLVPITPGVPPSSGTIFAPQGVQPNAKTPTVQEWNFTVEQQLDRDTSLRVAYVGSFGYHGLLSIDPNTIPTQICSNPSGCSAGGVATAASLSSIPHTVPQGAQYIPGPGAQPSQSQSRRGILLVHGRQQQLQRAASGCEPSFQERSAVPGKLHLVEGSGHELGAHRRASEQSGADDPEPERFAPRLGTVGVQCSESGQYFGHL